MKQMFTHAALEGWQERVMEMSGCELATVHAADH